MVIGHVLAKNESLDIVLQARSFIPLSCFTSIHTSFLRGVVISLLPSCSTGPASPQKSRARAARGIVPVRHHPRQQQQRQRVTCVLYSETRCDQRRTTNAIPRQHFISFTRLASSNTLRSIGSRIYCRIGHRSRRLYLANNRMSNLACVRG